MRGLINEAFRQYYKLRMGRIDHFRRHPHPVQAALFEKFLLAGRSTEWGKTYDYKSIKTPQDYRERVPVQQYEAFSPLIRRVIMGERDVLWPGKTQWFSKSSGTTDDNSKYIPITYDNLRYCHIRSCWDSMTLLYDQRPDMRLFAAKIALMGGSLNPWPDNPKATTGDISAIMMHHLPGVSRPNFAPDMETALMSNLEAKIERMSDILPKEDVAMIGGVPTWVVVLFRRILEKTGKDNMLEVWPNFQAYMHGGVSFKPYIEQFKDFIPSDDFSYQEIYNASEGYFGAQDDFSDEGMLLFLDNGIYYEFLPADQWNLENPKAIGLEEVELGVNYAIVITTNSGLWRYLPGDTVMFTSNTPYRIKVTGRTKHFVNAFGEEVMVENTDMALAKTCMQTGTIVNEYTVAPVYFQGGNKGGHQWLIEFERAPADMRLFNELLDQNLQEINSDYEAKRTNNMALEQLQLNVLPKNTFMNWMKSKGKYGGQNKIPRLANHREIIDEILLFVGEQA